MQSETGFPSSHQLKSYVAFKSRLKLAARAVLSADAGLLVQGSGTYRFYRLCSNLACYSQPVMHSSFSYPISHQSVHPAALHPEGRNPQNLTVFWISAFTLQRREKVERRFTTMHKTFPIKRFLDYESVGLWDCSFKSTHHNSRQWKQNELEMWAYAQRDGRPVEYRWRPLFNAAKFGWRLLITCRAVTLPRRDTRWNMMGCPKPANRFQPLVGGSSPHSRDMWRRYCCLSSACAQMSRLLQPCLNVCWTT